MTEHLRDLKKRLATVRDIETAAAVLEWDQETYMPPGAADARAEQIATIRQIGHERMTASEVGLLIDRLSEADGMGPDDTALVRIARRDFERATKLPETLVSRLARAVSLAKESWKKAREENDFSLFASDLDHILDLNREKAEALGYTDSVYDPLLDEFEPGFTTARLDTLFTDLRSALVPIVHQIAERPMPDASFLRGRFSADAQWDFGIRVIEGFGFD
ncbi:MAG: carboxypeptidase M32, partial [Rhodothermales bacterium]|nr:carboxypeptidase M32 [Rhodothermales bacterium]